MDFIIEGIQKAFQLISTLDSEIFNIVLLSLRVSLTAVILASLLGVYLGFLMAVKDYWGKRFSVALVNTLLALPTVVIGLIVYSLISRRGPLGVFELLYTPSIYPPCRLQNLVFPVHDLLIFFFFCIRF